MKATLLALLFALSSIAYASSNSLPSACGAKNVGFNVDLQHAQHTLTQPDPGKARVYFVQNLGAHNYIAQINVGLDGSWVGANRDNSYFSVSVDPGDHHVCENVKSHFRTYGKLVEVAHFTAEPGKIYYFRAQLSFGENSPSLLLTPIDSDEADHLIASYPLSVSQPKK